MAFEEVTNYINQIRRDFAQKQLDVSDLHSNPLEQLGLWLEEAVNAQILDPYAMVISTVGNGGKPSSRVVYLRGIYDFGLVFYTNYASKKGKDLDQNTNIACNFLWQEVERQIRIEGMVEKLSDELSDEYFNKRPRESKLGAWASEQSSAINSRDELSERLNQFENKFKDKEVPRPKHWGGYIIKPNYYEFWQGRPSRLHDRLYYENDTDGWKTGRLMP